MKERYNILSLETFQKCVYRKSQYSETLDPRSTDPSIGEGFDAEINFWPLYYISFLG